MIIVLLATNSENWNDFSKESPPIKTDEEETEGANATSGFVYLVFEYIEHDLSGILQSKFRFSYEQVCCC